MTGIDPTAPLRRPGAVRLVLHPRATPSTTCRGPPYGYPQSLGCVEIPLGPASVIWQYTYLGSLVTVTRRRGTAPSGCGGASGSSWRRKRAQRSASSASPIASAAARSASRRAQEPPVGGVPPADVARSPPAGGPQGVEAPVVADPGEGVAVDLGPGKLGQGGPGVAGSGASGPPQRRGRPGAAPGDRTRRRRERPRSRALVRGGPFRALPG